MDVKSPLRADHRFLKKVVNITLAGKVEHRPQEFTMISRSFMELGGSWERVFRGSPQDVMFLKKVVKRAFELGLLTKKETWKANG